MHRLAALALLLAACGSKGDAPAAEASSTSKAVETKPAPRPPANNELPPERDAEAAKLVKAGAACKVDRNDIDSSCPERKAAGEYAFNNQRSVAIAATCAELVRDANLAIKLTAAHCLYSLTSVATTPVLGHVFDSIEAERDPKLQSKIAWGIGRSEAVAVKLEVRAMNLVEKLASTPEGEDAAGSVLNTLFSEFMTDRTRPPKRADDMLLAAFARKKGDLFIRACDKVRHVKDKAAACAAVAGAVVADSPEWWRALGAFDDLGAPCADNAPAVLEAALGIYRNGDTSAPRELGRFAERFELTPELRKNAAAELTKARATAPDWKRKDFDGAIAAFQKPYEAPKK